jgi:outer membrane protein TolC
MKKRLDPRCLLVATAMLAGCTSYRPDPLTPSVELRTLRERTPQSVETGTAPADAGGAVYQPADGLDEAELVIAALSFNPKLRNRRYEMSHIGNTDLFGMVRFKPELKVDFDRATVGIAADSDVLYTLLVPSLRQAWRDDDAARREQSRAEMLAAEAQVVADVRRAHVTVLASERRVDLARQRSDHRRLLLERCEADSRVSPIERSTAVVALQRAASDLRRDEGEVEATRQELNHLLGFTPEQVLELNERGRPLVGVHTAPLAESELDRQLLVGRWELRALEAAYRRSEYNVSQAVMGQYPKVRLAPAVTYDREDGTSLKFGASLRIPWPERASEKTEDALKERDRARAVYLARLHELRAQAHAAHARLARSRADLDALERGRNDLGAALAESEARYRGGELSLHDYLPLVENCEAQERAWIAAALAYRLARIELDHATGRLNRIKEPLPTPPEP